MLKVTIHFFVLCAFCSSSFADIYIRKDEKGITHFSDTPEPGVYYDNQGQKSINLENAKAVLSKKLPEIYCSSMLQSNVHLFVEKFSNLEDCLSKMTEINRLCYDLMIEKFPPQIEGSQVDDFISNIEDCYKAHLNL
ncbi:DUF4124 domain-containing protein [Fluoribacter dumoffii]|uniref:DUF4124 domain-containing protein n=1 Tax=Fluoribacter dumoffii TaxID=463 RepID=A0A377G7H3_9GAMM|nr:DUF4124 domain-containing protein [Fluoribacter dumoffii]KTC89480.1 hypothetical protein Ldum_0548 [Fluoribacter dumoffii NY 23]STO20589.1 Uncharacterised protein [Fluoribacter dumoffii]